jgi:NAD-dependent deacetylase
MNAMADADAAPPDDGASGSFGAARAVLAHATTVAVLTGAGISTDSGIPDFRGPNGVWTRNPGAERRSTIDHYVADPEVRQTAWRIRVESEMWGAQPNAGHRAVTELDRQGRLHTLVTQNIDGLHAAAGTDPGRIVEIHGTVHEAECLGCGARGPMGPVLDRVRRGEADPSCEVCGGILKSATVMFGQSLVPEALDRARQAAVEAEVLVAVGTSLNVYPVAAMVPLALETGRPVVIVNAESTPFDAAATAVVRGSASEVLPALFAP